MNDAGRRGMLSTMVWKVVVALVLLVSAGVYVVGDLTSEDQPRPLRPAVILPAVATGHPSEEAGGPGRPGRPRGTPEDPEPAPNGSPRPSADDCDDDDRVVRPCPDDVDDDGDDDDEGSDDRNDD